MLKLLLIIVSSLNVHGDRVSKGTETPKVKKASSTEGKLELKVLDKKVKDRHGEEQVMPDCHNSNIRFSSCERTSKALIARLNERSYCVEEAAQAAGMVEPVTDAVIHCNSGFYSDRKAVKKYTQHRYGRACDGTKITVNGRTFNYLEAVKAAKARECAKFKGMADKGAVRASKGRHKLNCENVRNVADESHYHFYVKFLDCWGTTTLFPNVSPKRSSLTDTNMGVRDWREDTNHLDHFHISAPCTPGFCEHDMAYE